MTHWKHFCEPGCKSWRCPAALERIAGGWRNGRDPVAGKPCRDYFDCRWPECDCGNDASGEERS